MKPVCIVLGGPNGCGKSTLCSTARFRNLLVHSNATVINPDEVAKDAPPGANPLVWSGRIIHEKLSSHIRSGTSFLIESTLSGRNHFKTVEMCHAAGFHTSLHFVFLPFVALAKARVALRVGLGGHDVPEADQDRRFARSLAHGRAMAALTDEAHFYTNAGEDGPVLVAQFLGGQLVSPADRAPEWLKTGRFRV